MALSQRIVKKQKITEQSYWQWITQFSWQPKKEILSDDIYFNIANFCSIKELHKNSRVCKKWQTINKKVWAFFDVEVCSLLGEYVITTESNYNVQRDTGKPNQRISYPVIKAKVFFSKNMQESLMRDSIPIKNVIPLTGELNLAHKSPGSVNYNKINKKRHSFWFKSAGVVVGIAAVGLGLVAYHHHVSLKK